MSGFFTSKSLAAGYLSNTSVITLYQAPSTNVGYVRAVYLTSAFAGSQQINLFKNMNGNVYPWYTFTLNLGETADVLENETIQLTAGDSIQANTNVVSANAVAYTIHGVQEQ